MVFPVDGAHAQGRKVVKNVTIGVMRIRDCVLSHNKTDAELPARLANVLANLHHQR